MNRPSVIKENGSTALATFTYDDLSRAGTVTLGNGTSVQRGFDNQGALSTLTNALTAAGDQVLYSFTRNQVLDVTSVTPSNVAYQWSGATIGSQAYSADGLNRYTNVSGNAVGYDNNGNVTSYAGWTYGYDLDNRLVSGSTGLFSNVSLSYDAEGRLRQTVEPNGLGSLTTNLLYDGTKLVAEYDSSGNVLRRYVHGSGVDNPLVWYEGATSTNKNWFYADQTGSIVATADVTGAKTATYTYGPFGEPNTTAGTRFRYTGQQLIGSLGLYYYKGRFYSAGLGRFFQTDSAGYKDDRNLYAYVANNPVNRSDPTGSTGVTTGTGIQFTSASGIQFACAGGAYIGNTSGTGIQIACNGGACLSEAWSAASSHIRGPDSVSLTFPVAPGVGLTVTLDRYGMVYAGPSAGFSVPFMYTSPVSVNWTGYGTTPTPTQLQNYSGGWSATASVGLGATLSSPLTPGDSDGRVGFGFSAPGGSVGYSIPVYQSPFGW